MSTAEESGDAPVANPRRRTLFQQVTKPIVEDHAQPTRSAEPTPAPQAPRQEPEQSQATRPLSVPAAQPAAPSPPQQPAVDPGAVEPISRAVRQQQQAAASLAEQLAKPVAQPKPIPTKLVNTYQPAARANGTVVQGTAHVVGEQVATQVQIRRELQSQPQPPGSQAEWTLLRQYVQAQLALVGTTAGHSEHHGQAARLVTYLRTQPPAAQLESLQQLERGDPPVHALAIQLYYNLGQLLSESPQPLRVAETLPSGYGAVEEAWDPFAEHYRRVLRALRGRPRTRIVTVMDLAETGLSTRALLERACEERLVERGEIGSTGVYTLLPAGEQYLDRVTQEPTEHVD